MIEHSAIASDSGVRIAPAVRKRRVLLWTIVFATLTSLGLWALIGVLASAILRALFAA